MVSYDFFCKWAPRFFFVVLVSQLSIFLGCREELSTQNTKKLGLSGNREDPPVQRQSLTRGAFSWTFKEPRLTGQYANGDWWVVGPVEIIAITPSTTNSGGSWINGSEIDPEATAIVAGFDQTSPGFTYDHNLNVTAGISASNPLTISAGHSLVSSKHFDNPTGREVYEQIGILTVVAEPPQAGSFRPSFYNGHSKEPRFNTSTVDFSRLSELPLVGNFPDPVKIENLLKSADETYFLQGVSPWGNLQYSRPGFDRQYSRNASAHAGDLYLLMLSSNITELQKRALAIDLIQMGIDFFSAYESGLRWFADGGHGNGGKTPILVALSLLGRNDLLSQMQNVPRSHFGESSQIIQMPSESTHPIYSSCNLAYPFPTQLWWTMYHVNLNAPSVNCDHIPPILAPTSAGGISYQLCCTANNWSWQVMTLKILDIDFGYEPFIPYVDYYMAQVLSQYIQGVPNGSQNYWWRAFHGWHGEFYDSYRSLYP